MEDDFIKTLIKGSKSEGGFLDNEKPDVQLASVVYDATTDDKEYFTDGTTVSQNTDIAETTSKTTEQRPDNVLRLNKTNDMIQYTYLFETKYRIRDTSIPAKNGVEVTPVDAVNQLHRYCDAIYYTHAGDEKLKNEVIGGNVLYPGSLTKDEFVSSYCQKSVDEVNIDYDKLGEHLVYLVLHPVAEAVDGVEVRLVVACQPYEVDVALQRAL